MKLEKDTLVKVAGIAGPLLTIVATLLTNYTKEQQLNETIEKKVAEIMEQKMK